MWMVWVTSVAIGGVAFFLARYTLMRREFAAMSRAERRRAEIVALRKAADRKSLKTRIREELVRQGLGDNMFPFYAAVVVLYLAVAAPMTALGVPTLPGLAAAVPASLGCAWLFVSYRSRSRRSLFNKQMVDLLDLTVAQIKGGVGAERALQIVLPQMSDPIREEMLHTLAAGQAGRDLVAAMSELGERYPSRAFEMFVSALEIDRAEGHAIAPALEQAAALLKQDFALASEARAKLAQVKYEFYAVAGIVAGIALYMVFRGGESISDAYLTTPGMMALAAAAGNGAVGFWRFHRKLASLTGDTR